MHTWRTLRPHGYCPRLQRRGPGAPATPPTWRSLLLTPVDGLLEVLRPGERPENIDMFQSPTYRQTAVQTSSYSWLMLLSRRPSAVNSSSPLGKSCRCECFARAKWKQKVPSPKSKQFVKRQAEHATTSPFSPPPPPFTWSTPIPLPAVKGKREGWK